MMGTIDLVKGGTGNPEIVLFLIDRRCWRQIKMFWTWKEPTEQKSEFVVEFPYEQRSYGE
jgi:hypothetical protein